MRRRDEPHYERLAPGSVARLNLPTGPDGEVRACVVCAVYLVSEGERRAVLLLRLGESDMGELGDPARDRGRRPGVRRVRRGGGAGRGARAQRLPPPGHLVRRRGHVRRAADHPVVPPPAVDVARRPDPARADGGRDQPAGRRGRAPPRAAARRRPAPEAGAAAVRGAGGGQDAHRAVPDERADRDHDRAAHREHAGHDRRGLLGGAHAAAGHDRDRGRRPDRRGARPVRRRAPAAVPAAQRDGRAGGGRRRRLPAHHQPPRRAGAGAGAAPRPGRPGGGDGAARRGQPQAALRALPRRAWTSTSPAWTAWSSAPTA